MREGQRHKAEVAEKRVSLIYKRLKKMVARYREEVTIATNLEIRRVWAQAARKVKNYDFTGDVDRTLERLTQKLKEIGEFDKMDKFLIKDRQIYNAERAASEAQL